MRILMAGASGFLGSRLARHLGEHGHQLLRLVRREPGGPDERRWDPTGAELEPALLAGVDVVVNLAGASVGARRWTEAYKQIIRDSRIDTTAALANAIATAQTKPLALVNSSAVGFYGDTGDRVVDERSAPGQGFLADVCQAWEAAARPAMESGVRVVLLRTGLPLSRHGGLLKPLLRPFRLGLGGRLGGGQQYLPWISLPDWLSAVQFILDHDDLAGPVNLTAPEPVTNAQFTKALGRTLHRPAVVPVPPVALRILLGEFGQEALTGQRAVPGVLAAAGFPFRHQNVTDALRAALTGAPGPG